MFVFITFAYYIILIFNDGFNDVYTNALQVRLISQIISFRYKQEIV